MVGDDATGREHVSRLGPALPDDVEPRQPRDLLDALGVNPAALLRKLGLGGPDTRAGGTPAAGSDGGCQGDVRP